MAGFDEMSKEKLRETTSKGGKAKAEKDRKQDKTFEDVVKENTTNRDLRELYEGLMRSGKKGNVKAVETLLLYLNKGKEDKPTSLNDFIDEN